MGSPVWERTLPLFSTWPAGAGVGVGTGVAGGYGGIPHGPAAALDVIDPDGTLARLPLPSRHPGGPADSPLTLELSDDGSTLTYTAHFDENQLNDDRTAVIHRAGTYRYTYDVASRTISLTITQD